MKRLALMPAVASLFVVGCGVVSELDDDVAAAELEARATGTTTYKVLANNDLGMHCVDGDFSVFSILPPFNVVNAQVVKKSSSGKPSRLDASAVRVTYSAVADARGSSNSKSVGKTNFWQYSQALFGVSLPLGQGLTGLYMPAEAPNAAASSFTWSASLGMFRAEGIPLTPVDDQGRKNYYPLMRVSAYEKSTSKLLGYVDTVLPISDETTCANCHATGRAAAKEAGVPWATDSDLEVQARKNVLILHDLDEGTQLAANQPVLCASCHYSPPLDLSGAGPNGSQLGKPLMSATMHAFHADKMLNASGQPLSDAPVPPGGSVPDPAVQACYQCHPGVNTKCLRGAMSDALDCQNCHGGMAAVGGTRPLLAGGSMDGKNDGHSRRPWTDLPRCQSCHTGDAENHLAGGAPLAADGIRYVNAFRTGDLSASPFLATNKRFAEQTNTPYRLSKGHGGIACEGCHGSSHAWWANPDPAANDNVAAQQLQGHSGLIGECSTCHPSTLANTDKGPHGMHPVNSTRWIGDHEDFAGSGGSKCKSCHGLDLRGTVLSRAFADRTFQIEHGTKTVKKGEAIGCYTCHNGPDDD